MAWPRRAVPGVPSNRNRARGAVSVSGRRGTKEVAPNSPSDTAKAKAAPTARPRPATRRSISRRTLPGGAPSTAAASRARGLMDLSMGTTVRTTKGMPTTAWAMGTITVEVRRSRGGSSNTSRMPSPTVTADTPSGRVSPASARRPVRPARRRTAMRAADPPTATAMAAAAAANTRELPNAAAAVSGSRLTRSKRAR